MSAGKVEILRGGTAALAMWSIFVMAAATVEAAPQRGDYPWQSMQEHEFTVAEGGTLSIDLADADVAIVSSAGSRATITLSLRTNNMDWAVEVFETMNYRARLEGNTVILESDRRPRNSWRDNNWLSVRAEITIPSRFDLDIVTGDGDISLGSFRGDVKVRSGDGDLSIGSLDGNRINARTEDGDIKAARLTADSIEVVTADGDIDIEAVTGEISVRTRDGDIRIATSNSPQVLLDTDDGDIHISIAGDSRVTATTHDGDIAIVAPPSLQADIDLFGEDVNILGSFNISGRVSRGRATGRINGGGQEIKAHTNEGSITLVERNDR